MTSDISFWNRKKTGFEKIKIEVVVVNLYNNTIFFSNRFRNSMKTYIALGLIQTHTHTHTHTELVKSYRKLWL